MVPKWSDKQSKSKQVVYLVYTCTILGVYLVYGFGFSFHFQSYLKPFLTIRQPILYALPVIRLIILHNGWFWVHIVLGE
jgi:hypothetical protein